MGGAAALTGGSLTAGSQAATAAAPSLPPPGLSGIDHIVVVMMENRSFDHFLGWLPGADGKQAGLSLRRPRRRRRTRTHHLTDFQGCGHPDPDHSYEGGRVQYNGGSCDGWLRAGENDEFAIGYYTQADLGVLRPGGAVLDDLRPLLLRHHGRDLPEPLLPARGADRPAPQLDGDLARCRRSGTGSPPRACRGQYYYVDVPFTRAVGHEVPRHRPAATPSSSPTPPPGRCPRCRSSTRGSSTRAPAPRATTTRTPTSAPGETFLNQVYEAVTTGPGWASTAAGRQLRRVGRLLRPRRARRTAPDASPERPGCAGSGCRPGDLAAGAAAVRRARRLRPHLGAQDDRVALGPAAADPARRGRPQHRRGARLRHAAPT